MTDADSVRWWQRVIPTDGCWEWTGLVKSNGYGHMNINHTSKYAHRLAYEHFVGPIPHGLTIDHLCRKRSCVNPAHMEVVTRGENARRGMVNRTIKAACPHGHPYAGENVYVEPRGPRRCRICKRAQNSASRARKRETP